MFPAFFVLLKLVVSALFLVAVISLPPRVFMLSSSHCIDASTLYWMLENPYPSSLLDIYSYSISFLGCKALYIVTSFLVYSWSICSLVSFKNGPGTSYEGEQPRFLSLWWDFVYDVWFRVVFSFSWYMLLKIFFSFISARMMVSAFNIL